MSLVSFQEVMGSSLKMAQLEVTREKMLLSVGAVVGRLTPEAKELCCEG